MTDFTITPPSQDEVDTHASLAPYTTTPSARYKASLGAAEKQTNDSQTWVAVGLNITIRSDEDDDETVGEVAIAGRSEGTNVSTELFERDLVDKEWIAKIGEDGEPALLLGPIAIHPTRQGEGLGALLIMASLERARLMGWRRVVLIGDEPYYRRFGFSREMARALDFPKPVNLKRLLAKELVEGAMQAVSGMVSRWRPDDAQKNTRKS